MPDRSKGRSQTKRDNLVQKPDNQPRMGHDLFHLHSSHFFILPFDASSSEQMRNREKWRLIIQEAKAHPEL
jgi:hypothetical protein